jgi:DeoR/GlpR family transcriptional regulator of sugar metabolism
MLKEQRCGIILSQLRRKGTITVEELMGLTDSSRSTIRRDLEELEGQQSLRRIRGGATTVRIPVASTAGTAVEPPFLVRQDMYYEEKCRIAAAAHSLVRPGETLFLNGGTSVYEVAKLLGDISPLYVGTNDLKSAICLAEFSNVDLMVLGGTLRRSHYSLNGYVTESIIRQMHADKAFIGVDAVDFNLGYMNFSTEEIQTNRLMIEASHQAIVLCDHSKFEQVAFVNICRLQDIDLLITGQEICEEHLDTLHRFGVEVMTV